jgi:hypothetical protein
MDNERHFFEQSFPVACFSHHSSKRHKSSKNGKIALFGNKNSI